MKTTAPPYAVKGRFEDTTEMSDPGGIYPYLHVLRNRKGIIGLSVFIGLFLAFFLNLTQKPVYQTSVELILQPKDASKSLSTTQSLSSLLQDPTFLITQERLIRGPRMAERTLKQVEKTENRGALLETYAVHPSRKRNDPAVFSAKERQALISGIQRSISGRQVERGARIITISIKGHQPEMLARLTNAAAESYIEINYRSHMEAFQQSFAMISKSLAEIREKIKAGELAFQKINSEIRLLDALKIYGERHPQIIQLRNDIPLLVQKLQQGVRNLEGMDISQRRDLVSLLMEPHLTLEGLEKIDEDLHTLKPILEQEVNSNREMYNSIYRKLQEVEVSGGGSLWVDAEVVEPAGVPTKPVRPDKRMNLMLGVLMGLIMGISLAFFLEYLDSSVRSLEDVRNYLKLFPLGMVPYVFIEGETVDPSETDSAVTNKERQFWLASESKIPLYVAEAYRIIRTNVAFGSVDQTLKVLQVTSSVKGEGKTTTAANLAVSFALAGSRVLLVDADLRRPAIHRILGLDGSQTGLSEALTNGRAWESVVIPTKVPNLSCLIAGAIPPNPAELLSSKRMKLFIEEAKTSFDMVIIDSPPIISVADSAIVASRVDGTIFVSRSGFVPRHLCLQAKTALESVNGKMIGCVLNSVRAEHQPYQYHQYSKEYGRYNEEPSDSRKVRSRELLESMERFKALKEPFLIFLSTGWTRVGELLKWEQQSKKESKPSVGSK